MKEFFPSAESPKESFIQIDLRNLDQRKRESEDASYLDREKKILVAADGITRGPFSENEQYPYPSPAAQVAKKFVETFGTFLSQQNKVTRQDLIAATYKASLEVKKINQQLGLWANNDYLQNDLASTVFSACIQRDDKMLYAFMGDCGVAKLASDGSLLWSSPDEVTPLRPLFPKTEEVGTIERHLQVRRDFRNNPDADHATFGVISGEEEAMSYLRTGIIPVNSGEIMIAFSDGITEFLHKSSEFRKLLASGSQQKIKAFLEEHSHPKKHGDDKTLVLHRID